MKNKYICIGVILVVIVVGIVMYQSHLNNAPTPSAGISTDNVAFSPQNATFNIEGDNVELVNGYAEKPVAPDSSSKTITRYFGNELVTDLDADGVDDVAFILTQETDGSGVFYYAVGAVMTENGYVGTDAYLLGDRVAPQSTDISQNPRHKNVVVFNYVDRAFDEPMTATPSVGKSAYLKLVPETMQWAIVEPDFEGESNRP